MHFAPHNIFGGLDTHIAHIYMYTQYTQVNKNNTHICTCIHMQTYTYNFITVFKQPKFSSGKPSLSLSSPIKEEQMLVPQSKLYNDSQF